MAAFRVVTAFLLLALVAANVGIIKIRPGAPTVPASIDVPDGNIIDFILFARGTQNFRCASRRTWQLVDAQAVLVNRPTDDFTQDNIVARHFFLDRPINGGARAVFASVDSGDDSQVVVNVVATSPSPEGPGNFPWARTIAVQTSGRGAFDRTSYMLRIDTEGGVIPPANECGTSTRVGAFKNVTYTTQYWYFRENGRPDTIGSNDVAPTTPAVPPSIAAPTGNIFDFILFARGTQNFQCVARRTWQLIDARANLYNRMDEFGIPERIVGRHFFVNPPINGSRTAFGSTSSGDDSRVVVRLTDSFPSPDGPVNFPWARTVAADNSGRGVFSRTTFMLRINTRGGVAPPPNDCGTTFRVGAFNNVTYTTQYWYFRASRG